MPGVVRCAEGAAAYGTYDILATIHVYIPQLVENGVGHDMKSGAPRMAEVACWAAKMVDGALMVSDSSDSDASDESFNEDT